MKWMALLAIAACGGGGGTTTSGSGSGSGSGSAMASAPDLCLLGREALAIMKDCKGKPIGDASLKVKQQFEGVVGMARGAGGGIALQTTCAQMLHALDTELDKSGCGLPLSAAARTQMYDLVDAWYATRTAVKPTGNAAADAVVAKVVEIRDTACACNTALCLEGVAKSLDTITPFAADAPEAARTLGEKLLDDVSRCSARITKPVVRR